MSDRYFRMHSTIIHNGEVLSQNVSNLYHYEVLADMRTYLKESLSSTGHHAIVATESVVTAVDRRGGLVEVYSFEPDLPNYTVPPTH